MATSWAFEERKLIPLYEDLHSGKHAQAAQVVDKWLQTRPRSQPGLALKMALVEKAKEPGYVEEVLGLWEKVLATGWLTDRSVWLGTATLRSIDRADLVLEMHKRRWDERPKDISLGDPLFLAASTMGDYDTMAAVSRKLFNATKIPIWARMAAYSAYCQATTSSASSSSPPPDSDSPPSSSERQSSSFNEGGAAAGAEASFPLCPEKSLVAANLFLKTLPASTESTDVFWLRLAVLIGGREFAAARSLIQKDGHRGALSRRWVSMQAAAAIAAYDSDRSESVWQEEFETAADYLRRDKEAQSNYAFYRHVIDSVILGGVDAEKARSLFQELAGSVLDRSPALALLELDARLRSKGKGMDEAEWKKALEAYLDKWGGKWTAISEVVGVSEGREGPASEVMASRAKQFAQHETEKDFVALCVAELYALKQSSEGSVEEAQRLWAIYESGLQYGANLPKTDVQPADEIGLGAVEHLVRVWRSASDDSALQSAAVLLETILANSPSSFSARLSLIRVYRLLGAPSLAAPHLAKLKLSEIQLDSLGWVVLERADDVRRSEAWADFASKAEFMYGRSRADLPQYITHALEHESYSKIKGIQTLVNNLDRSVVQASLDADSILRDLGAGKTPDTAALKRLARAADSLLVDKRVYDLVPQSLASAVSVKDVQDLAAALLPIASYIAGDEAPLNTFSTLTSSDDKAALTTSLSQLSLALQRAVKEEGDAIPLSSLFTSALTPAEAATVVQVCDRLSTHLTEVLPTGKKKKNKNGQLRKARLFELKKDLSAVRELVPKHEVNWTWAPALGDEERRKELGEKVMQAREKQDRSVQDILKQ